MFGLKLQQAIIISRGVVSIFTRRSIDSQTQKIGTHFSYAHGFLFAFHDPPFFIVFAHSGHHLSRFISLGAASQI